jgi:hypothetical protein
VNDEDSDVVRYWLKYCNNIAESERTLCYWKCFCSEIQESLTEEFLADWEINQQRLEFMSDWEKYIDNV